ncbi:hypothetical protein SLEP1_g57988 [Rubroshorea leprosula]|uniref:Uncharacterized protein n=1 Tax=Rubroshorea leprosula TaxID=152421 RepID=A0AAV5MN98_9ROSI|nr:hypothetical protein SLEP1_g57988 [Rubroshorea leprosula]
MGHLANFRWQKSTLAANEVPHYLPHAISLMPCH